MKSSLTFPISSALMRTNSFLLCEPATSLPLVSIAENERNLRNYLSSLHYKLKKRGRRKNIFCSTPIAHVKRKKWTGRRLFYFFPLVKTKLFVTNNMLNRNRWKRHTFSDLTMWVLNKNVGFNWGKKIWVLYKGSGRGIISFWFQFLREKPLFCDKGFLPYSIFFTEMCGPQNQMPTPWLKGSTTTKTKRINVSDFLQKLRKKKSRKEELNRIVVLLLVIEEREGGEE